MRRARVVCGTVVAVLIAAGCAGVSGGAANAVVRASDATADVDSAPDATTAQTIAAEYDHPVLVDSETTEQSTVSALPDGTFQLSASNVPVRVKQDGDWVPVDTDLSRSGSWLEPAATVAPVRFSTGGSDVVDEVQAPSGEWISETWPHGPLPTPTIDGSTATYADVLPGVDLKLTATDVGMATVYVVKTAAAAASTATKDLSIDVQGATVSENASGTLAADPGTGPALIGASPVWWDSAHGGTYVEPGGDDPLRPVASTVTSTGVSIDVGATTASTGATYPVFIDPDWTANASWYTDKAYPNQSYLSASQSDVLRVGIYAQYQSDMFFQFSLPTSFSSQNTIVSSATLSTTQDSLDACPTNPIDVAVYGPKTAGFTWAQEQSYTGQWGPILDTKSPGSCSNPSAAVIVPWNVTAGVKAHLGQATIQFGLASQSSAQSRRHFERASKLTIVYDTRPNTPTGMKFGSPDRDCGTSAAPAVVNTTQGLDVQASGTDPDGGSVRVEFLTDTATVTSSTAVYTGFQSSGTTFSTKYPVGTFTEGTAHYLRAEGWDNNPTSTGGPQDSYYETAQCWFTVDNTPPNLPSVSATIDSAEIGKGISVTVSPGSASDNIVGYEYWVEPTVTGTVKAAAVIGNTSRLPACSSVAGVVTYLCSTGSPTLEVAPTDAHSELWVASYDAAGNVSPAQGLPLYPSGGSATAAAPAADHRWNIGASAASNVVADSDTTSAADITGEKDLTLGASIPIGTTESINGNTAVRTLTFSGTASAATTATTAAGAAGAAVNTLSAFTVSAWVKPTTVTGTHVIMAQSGATRSGFVLEEVAGTMRFCVQPQTPVTAAVDCAVAAEASASGTWTMVTGIWDPVNQQLRIILDDKFSQPGVGHHVPLSSDTTANSQVTIGADQSGSALADGWTGAITNPVLTQAVLGSQAVHDLYTPFAP